jgi:hypothetical protein
MGHIDQPAQPDPDPGGGEPVRWVLCQQRCEQRLQWAGPPHWPWILVHHRGQRPDQGALVEGRLALDGKEHGRAKRPHVGRRATWPPLSLLRRHVGGRAERQSGRRELWDTLERGDAKAGQPHPTVVPHHHVGRLDITVDDPGAVGGLQHTRHLSAELGHSRRR